MIERENDAFAEATDDHEPEGDRLEIISRLAHKQVDLESQLKKLDEEQKRIKKELLRVAQVDLPEAMDEISMVSLTLKDGFEVVVEEGVDASITKANRGEAHVWLDEHGFGDLVKREVKASMPRENPEIVHVFREFLKDNGVPYDEKEAVHPQTLKRFVREQLERGTDVPEDLFGIFNYRKAKITPAG